MRKKVLIVSDIPTHRTNAGNRNCILQNSRLLKECGYDVYLLLIIKGSINDADFIETKSFWGNRLFIIKQGKIQSILQIISHKICILLKINNPFLDLFCTWGAKNKTYKVLKKLSINNVIVNYVWLSRLLPDSKFYNTCIFTHDVFSNRNQKGDSYWYSFSPNKEAKGLNRAKHVLAIQENENIYFSYLAPLVDVKTVYMPFVYKKIENDYNLNLLFFSGNNEHNQVAIKKFIREVFPKIRYAFPKLKLIIGGGISSIFKDEDIIQGIEIKGYVENPKEFYSLGNVVINPVYSGTGLKVKTFEAISYGRITLVHPHSANGIFDKDNAPMIICENADDYINALKNITSEEIEKNSFRCSEYINKLNRYIKQTYKELL